MSDDPLFNKLGVSQLPTKTIELVTVDKSVGEGLEDDLDEVRSNIRSLIEKGEGAFEDLLSISSQSQDPKAYREASTLLKVLLDANSKLIDNALARKEIMHDDQKISNPRITNNNLFVGSTQEAIEMMRNKKKNNGQTD